MAEIEITLPTVQYGNVKVRATPEELGLDSVGDAAALGVAAAVYLTAFTLGFKRGAAIDVDIDDSLAHAGSGPYRALSAPQGTARSEGEEVFAGAVATAQEEAQRLLSEGLGGATEVDDDTAPWNKPAIDAPAKPWETEVATW